MHTQIKNLKSEKFTFITIICILLFSLIYMSMYSIMMKDEIKNFREEIEAINTEMDLLIEVIPVKDSVIEYQKEKIKLQLQELSEAITTNEITNEDNKRLTSKLKDLKAQVAILKIQAKQTISTTPTLVNISDNSKSYEEAAKPKPDTLLAAREKEIRRLKSEIANLKAINPEASSFNKLSAYYFVALSSDKKNRSIRTEFLTIQLQLKGDLSNFSNNNLQIEVRDPSNSIISSYKDIIKPSSHYIINYKFEPSNYKFIKGKYSIRIFSEKIDFQSVTFITLV